MARARIHLDSRAEHTALAHLCRQAAAGLTRQIALTSDPKKREAIRRKIEERELESELHRKVAEELQFAG